MALSNETVYLDDYYDAAEKVRSTFGITNRHHTTSAALDSYLGGGFGNPGGWEIVVVFGETGVGKSTFVMNMVAREAIHGTKIGYMLLEDDVRHFVLRMEDVVGEKGMAAIREHHSVHLVPKRMLRQVWELQDILTWIKNKAEEGVELFVIDHLQFVFENDADESNRNEYHKQRRFMRDLNFLLEDLNVTVIIVSHVSKSGAHKGMDRIIGSSAIAGAATKVLEFGKSNDGVLYVQAHKMRGVEGRDGPFYIRRRGYRLYSELDGHGNQYEPLSLE